MSGNKKPAPQSTTKKKRASPWLIDLISVTNSNTICQIGQTISIMDNIQQLMDQQLREQITDQKRSLEKFEAEQKANNVLLVKLDTKFDFMALSIKTLTESMDDKLTKFEVRIAALEQTRDQVNPQKVVSVVETHEAFIQDYKSTHKERNQILSNVAALIAFVISIVVFIKSLM